MSDDDIEGNHWGGDVNEGDSDLEVETNDETSSFSRIRKIVRIVVKNPVYILWIFIIILMVGFAFDVGPYQQNAHTDFTTVTIEETSQDVTVNVEHVKPHFRYVVVSTSESKDRIYGDAKVTYEKKELKEYNIDQIRVVGLNEKLEGEVRLRNAEITEELVLLRTFDVESLID